MLEGLHCYLGSRPQPVGQGAHPILQRVRAAAAELEAVGFVVSIPVLQIDEEVWNVEPLKGSSSRVVHEHRVGFCTGMSDVE